jgi:homoserine kinase
VHNIREDPAALLASGYFTSEQFRLLKDHYKRLLKVFEEQSLNMVEAWDHPDNVLNSCIGNYYGDIYEQQLEWAKKNRLNQTEFLPGFKKHFHKYYTSKI